MAAKVLAALRFASMKHIAHKRKDAGASPYINHPIEVAELLVRVGGVSDPDVLAAAFLHDTVEDTDTTPDELERAFGSRVREIVAELTDDKSLKKEVRKTLAIEHAAHMSDGAKQVKLGDMSSNVYAIGASPPSDWDLDRRAKYITWARAVVEGCRGANPALEKHFDEVAAAAEASLKR